MPPLIGLKIEQGDIGVKAHNKITHAVLHAVAQNHLAYTIPKHFEDNPSTRPGGPYGYRRRSKRWLDFKTKVFGHNKPNVATGELLSNVLGQSRITATKDRSRLYLKLGKRLPDWQRQELEALVPGELRKYIDDANRMYAEELKALGRAPKKVTTI